MHEYGAVESVVNHVLAQIREEHVHHVCSIRFRRSSAFSEDALKQAFRALSANTVLDGARLEIETQNVDFRCQCSYTQVVHSDDLMGHMFVCPNCGEAREIKQCHDLSLVSVVVEDAPEEAGAAAVPRA